MAPPNRHPHPHRHLGDCSRQADGMGSCWEHVLVSLPMMVTMGCMLERGVEQGMALLGHGGSTGESEVSRKPPNQLSIELAARRVQQGPRASSFPALLAGMDMQGLLCPLSHTKSPRMPSPGSSEPTRLLCSTASMLGMGFLSHLMHSLTLHEFLYFSKIHG